MHCSGGWVGRSHRENEAILHCKMLPSTAVAVGYYGQGSHGGCCLEAVGSLDGSQHVCGEEVFETDALVAMVGHDPPLMQWRFVDDCYGHAQ